MQVTLKSENEIDKQDVEILKKILIQADVADNATIMLKEMEKEQDEAKIKALREKNQVKQEKDDSYVYQKQLQDLNSDVGTINNALAVGDKFEKIQHIVKPFRIILSRVGNQLTAIDAAIEYKKTGDGLKVALKVGATIIADRIFQVGVVASANLAIATFIAVAIAGIGSISGAIVAGIAVFVAGVAAFWWISKQAEKLINKLGGLMIDYIRESDISFTDEEIRQMSVAHCHRTMEKIQNRSLQKQFNSAYAIETQQTKAYIINDTIVIPNGSTGRKQVFINGINITNQLDPNPHLLPNKRMVSDRLNSFTWDSLTLEKLEALRKEIENVEHK